VYERLLTLYSNQSERILEPFAGVGSGVYQAVRCGRLGIGCELKPSYWRQAVKNISRAELADESNQDVMEFESDEEIEELQEAEL
jgi:DNA modification methylase